MASSPRSHKSAWRKCAIRFAAVGLGSVAAGPLGAAVGSWLGPLIDEHAEKLVEQAGDLVGERLGE